MTNSKGGRPSKLTPKLQQKICELIQIGNSKKDAALLCGITRRTLEYWLQKAQDEESGPYAAFAEALEQAQATFKQTQIEIITSAAGKQWQAAAWLLERRFPREWGRRESISAEISTESSKENNDITLNAALLEDPQSRELLKELYRRQNALNS